jgi:pyrroline-5-carboxylate reductase
MKQTLGFIGGGRITRIFLHAFGNSNTQFSRIVVADPNSAVTDNLKTLFPDIQIAEADVAAAQDIVFIALHPPVIMETLELVKGYFTDQSTVVSLAPKVTIAKIAAKLSNVRKIARLIPNATSYINEGYNPVCLAAAFTENEKKHLLDILKLLGNTFEVSEDKLEGYAIMSAMLPTYFWFQWKELIDMGSQMGLTDDECKASIHETLNASLNTFFKSGLTANEVIDLVPIKPIGEYETKITDFYKSKLLPLYEKIKP